MEIGEAVTAGGRLRGGFETRPGSLLLFFEKVTKSSESLEHLFQQCWGGVIDKSKTFRYSVTSGTPATVVSKRIARRRRERINCVLK